MRKLLVLFAAAAVLSSTGLFAQHRATPVAHTTPEVENLSPATVKAGLEAGTVLLVDIRELDEIAAERISGALHVPLSSFDPALLPDPGERRLVFVCRSGNRTTRLSQELQRAGIPYDAHLAGGMIAWKAEGLPIVRD